MSSAGGGVAKRRRWIMKDDKKRGALAKVSQGIFFRRGRKTKMIINLF